MYVCPRGINCFLHGWLVKKSKVVYEVLHTWKQEQIDRSTDHSHRGTYPGVSTDTVLCIPKKVKKVKERKKKPI